MDSPEARLKALGEAVQAALETETQPSEQIRLARGRLLERVTATHREPRARFARSWAFGLAAAAVVGLAITAAMWRSEEAPPRSAGAVPQDETPLSFESSQGRHDVGDVLEARAGAPMPVTFSEGSRVVLQRGARARVLDTEPRGARVLLEGGALDVAVVHRAQTRWRFEAGPFHVLVKGTEFVVGWEPAQQRFALQMKSGSVEVSGACLPAPRLVEHTASLQLSCPQLEAVRAQPSAAGPSPSTKPEDGTAKTTAAAPSRAARPATATATVSFEQSCETASKAELVSWSNRERLAGHIARAHTALLALRKRFPGSSEASTAAFTLGRMAFEQGANDREAASWFAAYLAEQPNGPLMGDAAGRLIEAHERRGDRPAARRAATAYLERFPDGPYASKARKIVAE